MPPFDILRRPALPLLAWHYESVRAKRPQLTAGAWVAVRGDGFLEGCFGGPFDSGALDRQANAFGSGMSMRDGVPWFVGPSHTLEALYIYRDPDRFAVSNSIAFLVEAASVSLPEDAHYARRFATAVRGFDDYDRLVARGDRWSIERVVFDNFTCDAHGAITRERKPAEAPILGVADYCDRLKSVLRETFANGATSERDATFTPLSTCSSGYDSLTCTVLARELGARDAITIRRARGGDDDSGAPLAALLGLRVIEVDRKTAVSLDEFAEFAATGMGGEDVAMLHLEPHLKGRMVLTGFHGDKIWDTAAAPSASMSRGDLSGASLQEFRLRVGFVHVPVPMIFARQHERIRELADAAEMRPYTLRREYDRPIPRRIIEQAGVPREMFGTRKKAVGTLVFFDSRLLNDTRPGLHSRHHLGRAISWRAQMWAARVLMRVPNGKRLRDALVGDWRIFEHAHPRNSALFVTAVNELRSRYRAGA